MNAPDHRPHLRVDKITVTYNNGHTALHNASFELTGGTLCALVGINGSGKSTLFNSIMGMVRPSTGTVTLDNHPMAWALRNNLVAYVPQTDQVDWHFPVQVSDVVMMGRYGKMSFLRIPSTEDRRQVALALARVGMTALAKRQIGELSGGQRKRVFLARALAQQGRVMLLDEPFTGIDVHTESAIIDLLITLREEGQLILISTHNLAAIPEFCDRVVLINRTVLAAGPTDSTFTQENLQRAFGGDLRYLNPAQSLLPTKPRSPRAETPATSRATTEHDVRASEAPNTCRRVL
ncbi:ATP-binding cassette domain-containing protein [Acerihabitans sp. TG2]|uniref:metal ABC transporter ATP-binding protein n=1 Tax=Acerihabitans sp. TG2 TaxID=3096008 RepID=UPI002B22A56F|nr:ATP-binding cassette domain-containing protein [Acerihabitans sp. TG2]MEA9391748.1 ATP-binding cassette domain-containing protein [Acerihabitans sp. TG2]